MLEHLGIDVILFDVYGTLLDIHTSEHSTRAWQRLARFLRYQGLPAREEQLHDQFFMLMREERAQSGQKHPEFDAVKLFRKILDDLGHPTPDNFAVEVAQLWRVLTIQRFGLFSDTLPVLEFLQGRCRFGLISDAQRVFLEPELEEAALHHRFEVMVVSSDHGFRKPDARLFHMALKRMEVPVERACYVGDNPVRDIGGAQSAGLRTIWVKRSDKAERSPPQPPTWTVRSLLELPPLFV